MKPQQRYRTVSKRIHPPEADQAAGAYHQAQTNVGQYRDNLKKILNEMDTEWEGNQKDRFIDHTRREEARIGNYYSYLGEMEKRFCSIEVVVEVQEPIPFA
jgi:uncharacterized protein YukE